MHGVLAAIVAAAYGVPLLWLQARYGITMPQAVGDYGMAMAETIFPVYSAALIAGTTILTLLTTTVVSFIPARKIARLNPVDAIRGRSQ
jgi:ABC-type antimicrobial peptide transport system permease subunit